MSWFAKALVAGLGLAFFAWNVSRVGWGSVWQTISSLGWATPLILVPYFIVYVVDCAAWRATLPPGSVPFWTAFRIRWSGESVNNLIPTAYVGGETVKVLLLRKLGIDLQAATTAAVISRTAQSVAQLLFVLLASFFFLALAPADSGLRTALLFILLGGLLATAALIWVQRVGIFNVTLRLAKLFRIKSAWLDEKAPRLKEMDATIFGYYSREPRRVAASTALYFCGWLLDTLEVCLVAHLLGVPITWTQAVVVEAFTGVAKAMGMWIPGSIGVQETGITLVGRLAGLSAPFTGAYALIRRARELVFAGIGILLLYSQNLTLKAVQPAPAATK